LHRADGSEVRLLEANPFAFAEFRLSKPEFLHVSTRDGFEMEGW
jgi:hypothetical protein